MNEAKTAVLLVNLGTPEAPTAEALKPYLREFLSDRRVIEVNPIVWKLILNLLILPRRSKASAEKYKTVWRKDGSPLLSYTRQLAEKLGALFDAEGFAVRVGYAMRYGRPSLLEAIPRLHREGVEKILIVPLYPQYSATTTATAMDKVCEALTGMRSQPEIRVIRDYHDHPAYIESIASSIQGLWKRKGALAEDGRLVLSFHGMPKSYCEKGDPYDKQVKRTVELVTEKLGIDPALVVCSYQSRFGKDVWLQPYTAPTLAELAKSGVKRVDAVCPGFSADCLETLEEIKEDAKSVFISSGGKTFNYISCLNAGDQWVESLKGMIEPHLGGWISKEGSEK